MAEPVDPGAGKDLFADALGHGRPPLQVLVTDCNFAVINGRRLCVAGLDRFDVLMPTVESETGPGPEAGESSHRTPAGEENTIFVNAHTDAGEDGRWVRERVRAGDENVVRVVAAGPFDPPAEFGPPEDE